VDAQANKRLGALTAELEASSQQQLAALVEMLQK
jgi:hypothetical protein